MITPDHRALEDLYDEETLSLIAARDGGTVLAVQAADEPPAAAPSPVRFRGVRGAMLAGAMLGVAEVFEPEPDKQSVIEFAPAPADHGHDPIEFVFVHGSPERSRIIFRPWLSRS